MTDLWSDIKHALHLFVKSPGFTFAAVAALALGIGANTAIFTVVNAVLLKPLGYPDADRIMQMMTTSPQGQFPGSSITKFQVWQQQTSIFKDVAAYDFAGPGFNITGDRPELIHGIHVSEAYFRVFGAPVTLGRTFTKEEDAPNGGDVVVLSYGLWQRRFGGNPNVVGQALQLSGEPYTIIGVLGRDFRTDPASDIWIPFQFEPNSVNQGHFFMTAAMLKPGVTVAQANAQMKLAYAEFRRKFPSADPKGGFAVQPLRDSIVRNAKTSLFVLLGAVGLVLLIACANVANLLLVRATGRKKEFAIRAAMGASRTRVIRQLLTESVMLAVAGGVLGLALGFLGVRWLLAISPAGLPRIGENGAAVGVDWRVLVFTLLVSCATGILFGLFPAFSVSRTDLNSTLKESSNRSGTSFRTGITRAILVVTEVMLAMVLLVCAALLIRTFVALHAVNTGFDGHNVLTMEMSLNGDKFSKTAAVAQLSRDGRERLNRIPGVESSTFSCCLPVQGQFGLPFAIIGRPVDPSKGQQGAGWMHASADYYKTFKIPVKRGREFNVADTASSPHVVIINEAFAKQYFPNENPVGQQIAVAKGMGPPFEEPARTIVGVVGNTHDAGLDQDTPPLMVVPDTQVLDAMTELNAKIVPLRWAVRTKGDPRQLSNVIAEQLRQASGGFPVARIKTMDEIVSNTTSRQTFNMTLLSIFGAIALTLAAIGIYGLMAYSVQQRTQEIGIRMALGAERGTIRKLVVWSGMKLALIGMVLGIAASFGLTRLIASFLFGVKTWDPTAFIAVPAVLCAVAFVAVWLPALRASRVEPMRALRVE